MPRSPAILPWPLLALIVASALLPVGSGCFRRWIKFRTLRIDGIEVKAVEGASFRLDTRCQLENPNSLGATLTEIAFTAKTGSYVLGRGKLKGPIHVGAHKRFDLVAPLIVRYADLPADFPKRVAGGHLPLTIETRFVAATSLGRYTMDLTSSGSPRIAKALEVAIHGSFRGKSLVIETYTLGKIGLRGITLDLHVKAQNFFAFPIRIRRATYRVDVNDKPFGVGTMTQPLALGAHQTKRHLLAVRATHGAVGHAVMAIFGKAPRFRVRGKLWIDPVGGVTEIPIDLTANASVFDDEAPPTTQRAHSAE